MIEYFLGKFRVTGTSTDYLGFALLLCVSDLQQILQKLHCYLKKAQWKKVIFFCSESQYFCEIFWLKNFACNSLKSFPINRRIHTLQRSKRELFVNATLTAQKLPS